MKQRGAQPHNTNASRHGIYSKHYTPDEIDRIIARLVATPHADQIDMLIGATHVVLDRIIARLGSRRLSIETFARLVALHNETAGRIAALVRTHRILNESAADSLAGHIAAVLDEINEALHHEDT